MLIKISPLGNASRCVLGKHWWVPESFSNGKAEISCLDSLGMLPQSLDLEVSEAVWFLPSAPQVLAGLHLHASAGEEEK